MNSRKIGAVAALVMLSLAPLSAVAERGGKHGRGQSHEEVERYDDQRGGVTVEFHFGDRDRGLVQEYYRSPPPGRRCPPGLAKKGNGCMPPGQAKKWIRGRPLPRDVVVYELPQDLRYRLPPPPQGHRYVRIAGDVLLIAIGSSMVIDALEDIVR